MNKIYTKMLAVICGLFLMSTTKAQVTIFSENWSSSSFTTNAWTFPNGQSNWLIGASYTPLGGAAPNAYFNWSPSITNYSIALLSNTINATGYTAAPITLDYLLQLNNFSTATLEEFKVEYKTIGGTTWSLVAAYNNTVAGTSNWAVSNATLTGMEGQVFQIKFTAFGANSFNLNGWGLDNITVKAACIPALAISLTPTTLCTAGQKTLTASGSNNYTWTPGASTNTSIVINPTVTSTYSVASTNTVIGCVETRTLLVGVTPTITITGPTTICASSPATLTASGSTTYTWNTGSANSSITVSPSVTTVYNVSSNSGGCVGTAQHTITTAPSPTITVSGPTLVCNTSTNVLTASGASTYSWNTGATSASITITPSVNTTYTVTGVGSNGCSIKKTTFVTVSPLPNLNIAGPANICSGNSATLVVSGASTYTWNTGATTNSIVITPSLATTYSVTGTSTAGCVSTKITTVSVTNPTITTANAFLCAPSGSANLTANAFSGSIINWYASPTSTVSLATGSVYASPTVTANTTYYAQASNTFSNTILTPTLGGNGSTGNMFDVVPNSNITLNAVDMSISTIGTVSVEVWYRPGTFVGFESANTGWISLITTTVNSPGTGTLVNVSGFSVNLNAGQTYGLYVTTNGGGVNYTNGTAVGNTLASNGDITVKQGKGGGYFGVTIATRNWNGRLYYIAQGCSSPMAPATVSVNAAPTVSVTGPSTVCAGQPANISASGATSYTWNTGATTSSIAPTPTANATYTVTGANGTCTANVNITVSVSALPTVSLTASQTTVCTNGSTVALTGSPAGGVYTGSNVAGSVFTPGAVAGTFTPSYSFTSAVNGCSKSVNTSIVVKSCVGIDSKTASLSGLSVYPNPTTGIFSLELSNGAVKNIVITDLTGRVILTETSASDKFNINISNFANGVYFMKVQSNSSVEVIRIVKH